MRTWPEYYEDSTSRRMSWGKVGSTSRRLVSFLVLVVFVLFVLFNGVNWEFDGRSMLFGAEKAPDFSRYNYLREIGTEELAFDVEDRRLLFVGDIHGQKSALDKLLTKVQYHASTDLLIHTGDFIAKASLKESLSVLSFFASHNITGVRGNHDQQVVEWRGWINNVLNYKGGKEWLKDIEKKSKGELKELTKKSYDMYPSWKRIPEGWELMGDHYSIARNMSDDEYDYLVSLPLILHIPLLHAFVVHAGILPLDPRYSITSLRQPLSHVPSLETSVSRRTVPVYDSRALELHDKDTREKLRAVQERAVLSDVPQNNEPWNLLNMRGIEKGHKITKDSKDGLPWSELWNEVINKCNGFTLTPDSFNETETYDFNELKRVKHLPCYSSTVVYGHAASRGLDDKRWSKGLDTGCVYGRELTTLVVEAFHSHDHIIDDIKTAPVKFSDKRLTRASLVSVSC